MHFNLFDDDGTPIDPERVKVPSLCTVCKKKDDPYEEPLCILNRYDQADEDTFKCGAFVHIHDEKPYNRDEGLEF